MSASNDMNFTTNIKEIIEKAAWKRFMSDKGFPKSAFYRKGRYYIDIRWGYVDFKHKTTRFETRPDDVTQGMPGDKSVILYYSDYENKTPLEQSYTFSTARETTASTSIEFQENYTIGAETSIEIKCPGDIVTVGAGLSGSMSVTKTEGQTFEETLSWNVSTDINVKAGHKLRAKLCVFEKTSVSDFEVETTMSLVREDESSRDIVKKLPVAVRRRSDDKIVHVILFTNFETLFKGHVGPNLKIEEVVIEKDNREMVTYAVVMTTHGSCKSISWKKQHVEVESKEINGAEAKAISAGAEENEKDGE